MLTSVSALVAKQSTLTYTAIVESFEEKILYFFKYGSIYIPMVFPVSTKPLILGDVAWAYYNDHSTFYCIEEPTDIVQHLSYIGASLECIDLTTNTQVFIKDMSEWIQDQYIQGPVEKLPLQVLVSAWGYCSKTPLNHTYEGYVLTLMDLEGNEIQIDLESGAPIHAPTSSPTTSSTESSIDETELDGELPIVEASIDTIGTDADVDADTDAKIHSELKQE